MMKENIPPISITQLNRQVRLWLEQDVGEVCVIGELSNLAKPASGHLYFTLKDDSAQIRCVFFRSHHHPSNQTYANGQQVIAQGRLSLYEARGEYQLIVQQLTHAGIGLLYQKFAELKQKLALLGLFEPHHKKPFPAFPATIAIVTSPTGAAIRDILITLARRFPLAEILIYPSEVQGKNAAAQLIAAIKRVNQDKRADVLILARGGGSIEDLWPFNDELLAYAIRDSTIPIVSGVGHETDFTIADFVADLRAATPTAAAETITPDKTHLLSFFSECTIRMHTSMKRILAQWHMQLAHHQRTLLSPAHLVTNHWQSLYFLEQQLHNNLRYRLQGYRHTLQILQASLETKNPCVLISQAKEHINRCELQLRQSVLLQLHQAKQRFNSLLMTLNVVSPLATLERGYAIATHKNKIIFDSSKVKFGDELKLQLAKGQLLCIVSDQGK